MNYTEKLKVQEALSDLAQAIIDEDDGWAMRTRAKIDDAGWIATDHPMLEEYEIACEDFSGDRITHEEFRKAGDLLERHITREVSARAETTMRQLLLDEVRRLEGRSSPAFIAGIRHAAGIVR